MSLHIQEEIVRLQIKTQSVIFFLGDIKMNVLYH